MGVVKGDSRSLDYSSYGFLIKKASKRRRAPGLQPTNFHRLGAQASTTPDL